MHSNSVGLGSFLGLVEKQMHIEGEMAGDTERSQGGGRRETPTSLVGLPGLQKPAGATKGRERASSRTTGISMTDDIFNLKS